MSKAVEIIDGVLFVHTRHYDDVNRVIICHQKKPFRVFSDDAKKKPSRPHGEWIPIKWKDEETKCKLREYPFDGKWVIVTDGKNISVERIKIDALDHFFPAGRWFELEDVVAWMPLPKPYKEGGDEE